MRVTTAE